MGYDDLYMDEDGEPLMDPDAASDREFSPELALPVDNDDEDEGDWGRRDRSPTPVMNSTDDYKSGKPKKRLVKRGREKSPGRSGSPEPAFDEEWLDDYEDENSSSMKKMKSTPSLKEGKGGSLKKNKENCPRRLKRTGSLDRGRNQDLRATVGDREMTKLTQRKRRKCGKL
ncbi:hypothetical protein ZIOFF_014490 [Zingiber officinale]|uniref:Uncharacterized protein n=1 Tax=Zingiber officinale TaxID=94328 RepID=A0A8J5HQ55_ZINOF|nr:hypothetical protein ZIOFF_014490 [Zingiber officinale]